MTQISRFSRAIVHNAWIVYIALPSPIMQMTLRSGPGGAGTAGGGGPKADRATHVVQPVVRRRAGAEREKAAARGHRFVDHDRALGHRGAERLSQAVERELAGRTIRPARLGGTRRLFVQTAELSC